MTCFLCKITKPHLRNGDGQIKLVFFDLIDACDTYVANVNRFLCGTMSVELFSEKNKSKSSLKTNEGVKERLIS